MDAKNYIDRITLEYLSGSRYNQGSQNNENIHKDEVIFYKKRIINTTRELIKKITDPSYNETNDIIDNNSVQEAFKYFVESLVYSYKQDDMRDMIKSHNGFIEIDVSNNDLNDFIEEDIKTSSHEETKPISITQIDNNIFSRTTNMKNKYDWSRFCKVDKKVKKPDKPMPKLGEYNLKDPSLRLKGVKNKKSTNNIVSDDKK